MFSDITKSGLFHNELKRKSSVQFLRQGQREPFSKKTENFTDAKKKATDLAVRFFYVEPTEMIGTCLSMTQLYGKLLSAGRYNSKL